MRILPTDNEGNGFHGQVWMAVREYGVLTKKPGKGYDDDGEEQITAIWNAVSAVVARHVAIKTPEVVRAWLDSTSGRLFYDEMTSHGLLVGNSDARRKVTPAQFATAAEKTIQATKWIRKELQDKAMLTRISEGVLADDGTTQIAEDFGDIPFHANPGDFLVKKGDNFASNDLYAKIGKHIERVLFSKAFNRHYRSEVLTLLRKDKALLQQIRAEGFTLSEAHMRNEITTAVFETTEDDELPFTGEMVVEGDDGASVTLDESDLFEDVVIEALEDAIADAVQSDPNTHVQDVREIDEALQDGNYERAVDLGVVLLRKLGVDEAQIDEFKKGFKVSGSQRAKMARMRKKPKTGSAMMALRARRRAARKSSSRMKRARYYKQNKRRIARRRAQLQNSAVVNLDATLVAEMAEQGLTVVVVQEGEEPVFVSSRELAEQLAGDGAHVIELSEEQIDEACKKSGGKRKGKMPAKMADDEADESLAEKDCEDEEEEDDEEDYEDGEDEEDSEDDEEETDESVDEAGKEKPFGSAGKTTLQQKLQIARQRAAAAKRDAELRRGGRRESVEEDQLDEKSAAAMANEIAKFLKAHPDVGYGELATRFKIGRDVAQQAVILAGNVAGGKAKGDQASWLYLAKEILGKLMAHSSGAAPDSPGATKFPAKDLRQVASIEGGEADLVEDEDVDEASATWRGPDYAGKGTPADAALRKHGLNDKQRGFTLFRLRMAASESEFYDDLSNFKLVGRKVAAELEESGFYRQFHESVDITGDPVDEAKRAPKVVISAGNKAGTTKVAKAALPKPKLKGKEGAIKSAHSRGESVDYDEAGVLEWFSTSAKPKGKQQDLYDIWNALGLNLDTTDRKDIPILQDVRSAVQAAAVALETGERAEMSVVRDLKKALTLSDYNVHPDFKDTIRSTLAKLNRPAKRESVGEPELVEVTVPMSKAEALVAAATRHGLPSTSAAHLDQASETVTLMVPARLADAIRADVA